MARRIKPVLCEKCGGERVVGDWPFCKGDPKDHQGRGMGGFSPFTPYVDPHILPFSDPRAQHEGKHPVLGAIRGTLIESREQRKRIMKEQNLDWAPRPYGGLGGSEF